MRKRGPRLAEARRAARLRGCGARRGSGAVTDWTRARKAPPAAGSRRTVRNYELEESDTLEESDELARDEAMSDGETSFDWLLCWLAPFQLGVPGELCRNDGRAYLRALLSRAPAGWALRMADASGKLPDGVLFGSLNLLSAWDECLAVQAALNASRGPQSSARGFSGRLCAAAVVPDASSAGLRAVVGECQARDDAPVLDGGDWAAVAFLTLTGLVVLGCTVVNVAATHEERARALLVYRGAPLPPGWRTVCVRAFSLYRNVRRLLSVQTAPDNIGCLHGLRFISMTWVILGHTYIVDFLLLPLSNMGVLPEVTRPLPFQAIMNAPPAVDMFLLLSGAMFSYSLMNAQRAGRRIGVREVLSTYLHRYLRLTPLYAVVVWLTATLRRHIGRGSFTALFFGMFGVTGCRRYWRCNPLYINNLYPNGETVCIDQAWYVGLDFQMFVVAPLLVLPFLWNRHAGAAWLTLWGVVSAIIPGVITYVKHLPPTLLNLNVHANDRQTQRDFTLLVYNAPWSPASPYIIGLGLGLLLDGARTGRLRRRLSTPLNLLLWVLAAAVALLVVYGMHAYNREPSRAWMPAVAVAYAALHRPAWALACGWVVLACATGHGGPVNSLLSQPSWAPLGRLTSGAYLTSMQLQVSFATQARVPFAFTHTLFVFWFLAHLVVNVALAACAGEFKATTLHKDQTHSFKVMVVKGQMANNLLA
ncbi:nose resistant to fluoxetine protein 6-like [Pollicipes pollicipes]|uniref:nose resistant to fluoxetine protein 6-like n=1 Tax=Pollicipes pollicipes TaxID=41117 RepID=UPI001884C77C|nr:nose resistant to fluoxetine protein 6-like [Pollicipes pollicipes]